MPLNIAGPIKNTKSSVLKVCDSEFKFTFSRSSGAGGQNINKVNTKATLIWNIEESTSVSSFVKDRFKRKYKRFIKDDFVVISSQKSRTQTQNIEDCKHKLHEYLKMVEFAPKTRKKTRPTKGSVKRRLDTKKKNSLTKKNRTEKF